MPAYAPPTEANARVSPALPPNLVAALTRRDWNGARYATRAIEMPLRGSLTRLIRNLQTCAGHQPTLADALLAHLADRPVDAPLPDVATVPPTATAARIHHIASRYGEDGGPALAGTDDAQLLCLLAQRLPPLLNGQAPAVVIVEPEPDALLAQFSRHDFAQPGGPLTDPRHRWFVGPDAEHALGKHLDQNPLLPCPTYRLALRGGMESLSQTLAEAIRRRSARLAALAPRLNELGQRFCPRAFSERVRGASGDRPPRVLIYASRFTSVLRYAAADAQHGFKQLGWDTCMVTEENDQERLSALPLAQAVASFEPDAVFTLNQPRDDANAFVPTGLPFISWYQDQAPHLMNRAAGETFGPRDFMLSVNGPLYTGLYGYRAEQIIAMPKLTRVAPLPATPATAEPADPEVVYVSNAARTARSWCAHLLRESRSNDPRTTRWIADVFRTLRSRYEDGGSIGMPAELARLIDERAVHHMGGVPNAAFRELLVTNLYATVNNALYRHQALRWAAESCRRHGLRLSLYGNGWDKHPEFAPHARGPITYGADLESATRRATFNLQIIPSGCQHQRLIDGIAAGGFFLIRRHPADALNLRVMDFIRAHLPDHVRTEDAARAHLDPAGRKAFDTLRAQCADLTDFGQPVDLITWARGGIDGRVYDPDHPPLPGYDDVAFDSAASLDQAISRFKDDAQHRRNHVRRQHASIETRLSYRAGLDRVMRQIAERLAAPQEPSGESEAA